MGIRCPELEDRRFYTLLWVSVPLWEGRGWGGRRLPLGGWGAQEGEGACEGQGGCQEALERVLLTGNFGSTFLVPNADLACLGALA